jgi:hypothetical protein
VWRRNFWGARPRDPVCAFHANLAITSVYLQRIDSSRIITTIQGRPSSTISATAGLEMQRYVDSDQVGLARAGRPGAPLVVEMPDGGCRRCRAQPSCRHEHPEPGLSPWFHIPQRK